MSKSFKSISSQNGQALIFVLACTIVLSMAMIYLFNTSQLLAERTQAQLLNANAYMNKAKIANQLATAQAISVASWAEHFEPMPRHTQYINLIPYIGPQIQQSITQYAQAVQPLSDLAAPTIFVNNQATAIISFQQNLLNNTSIAAIQQIHEDTLNNSSIGTDFDFRPIITTSKYAVNPLGGGFIKQYSGNSRDSSAGRTRLKDVILASRDDFTRVRRATSIDNFDIPIFRNRLEARGGTEISNDMNQWKSVDTLSHHYKYWKTRRFSLPRLVWRKDQIGYGSALVRSNGVGDNDRGNTAGYNNVRRNRDASNRSSNFIPRWDSRNVSSMGGESGVPRFWDL